MADKNPIGAHTSELVTLAGVMDALADTVPTGTQQYASCYRAGTMLLDTTNAAVAPGESMRTLSAALGHITDAEKTTTSGVRLAVLNRVKDALYRIDTRFCGDIRAQEIVDAYFNNWAGDEPMEPGDY